jgi:hypothetical protein
LLRNNPRLSYAQSLRDEKSRTTMGKASGVLPQSEMEILGRPG